MCLISIEGNKNRYIGMNDKVINVMREKAG